MQLTGSNDGSSFSTVWSSFDTNSQDTYQYGPSRAPTETPSTAPASDPPTPAPTAQPTPTNAPTVGPTPAPSLATVADLDYSGNVDLATFTSGSDQGFRMVGNEENAWATNRRCCCV